MSGISFSLTLHATFKSAKIKGLPIEKAVLPCLFLAKFEFLFGTFDKDSGKKDRVALVLVYV